ncbi:hypothetical protein ACFOD0_01245 [Shewanella intestini]|uniref:Uncharacterized protein n=1 Tax=Shewanella intestini TaxID=2017544 RepID=A0ABS5HZM0_9GAMM|nr:MULTISPECIES: hypothetical protein [Shewanella]MBR9727197.1 hypothetical protein [Shewanella intestini]MRG35999.1 hypothetical protein [Shewanella sp. XMDDZSB0408]
MDRQLTILYRLEPGCLGPDGIDHIEAFCLLVQKAFIKKLQPIYQLNVVPRYDKSLAEIQFSIGNKVLNDDQADAFFNAAGLEQQKIIDGIEDKLTKLINQYIARK